jgi:hypothetical protein
VAIHDDGALSPVPFPRDGTQSSWCLARIPRQHHVRVPVGLPTRNFENANGRIPSDFENLIRAGCDVGVQGSGREKAAAVQDARLGLHYARPAPPDVAQASDVVTQRHRQDVVQSECLGKHVGRSTLYEATAHNKTSRPYPRTTKGHAVDDKK